MNKLVIFILFSLILAVPGSFANSESLDSLDYYIDHHSEFDKQKVVQIQEIKNNIVLNRTDNQKLYLLYADLYEEYRSFIYDSAYVYVEKLIDISSSLNDIDKITSSNVKLGFCYLSSGLFKEAFDVMNSISVVDCNNETKIEYYTWKARLYFDLGDYNNSAGFREKYNETGCGIIDSAITLLPHGTTQYWSTVGLRNMKSYRYTVALQAFNNMINSGNYTLHEYAIATSSIAYVFNMQGKIEEAKKYFTKAAIADIKSSVKETVATRNLARLLYEEREIGPAVRYIRKALDDASFYNARHRQLEIGHILPIIERERINIIENQRDRMIVISVFISVLVVALFVALIIIWKSLKRLNLARLAIQKSNNELTEANKIKDEYIAYFFYQNSDYIEKIEKLQKWVNRKVATKQYHELRTFTQITNVHEEREALFQRFDQIFLKLFPDFVNEFNKLLKPEEQIHPKDGELLNPDLRIYALIRLGINDNEKIASFLNYSVNTIYSYKTKIKGKAACTSDEFKQKILEIKSI